MVTRIAIIGSGGHGREVLQVVRAAKRDGADLDFVGFYDDAPDIEVLERLGARCLGPVADARASDFFCYLGLGGGALKERLSIGIRPAPPVVHPLADVGDDVRLGAGAVIFAQATVTTNVSLGVHCHVGRGAAVGHDSDLGDYSSVMPLASISGNVHAGRGVFVGTGALVRQGVALGDGCTIGMGAVVLGDVAAGVTVVGNPARVLTHRF